MKKSLSLIVFISLISSFLFIGGCENNNQITNSNQQSLESIDQQLDELEKNVAELSLAVSDSSIGVVMSDGRDPKKPCCNNLFPLSSRSNDTTGLLCPPEGEQDVLAYDCAKLWAKYQHTPNEQLGNKGCNKPIPPEVPTVTGLNKSQSNNHPYFTWNFMYCHKYRIERKIGSGGWTKISEIENCDRICENGANLFTDNSIDLNTITQNISYRVRGNIFNSLSSGGSVIIYSPPAVTVNINGPTQLLSGQSGTFTANVGGGVPPYNYSWQKYQYCNDRSQSNDTDKDDETRSVPCGFWESIPGNTSTVYVSGFIPSFELKVTVTDQNGSATDYHLVTVSLP